MSANIDTAPAAALVPMKNNLGKAADWLRRRGVHGVADAIELNFEEAESKDLGRALKVLENAIPRSYGMVKEVVEERAMTVAAILRTRSEASARKRFQFMVRKVGQLQNLATRIIGSSLGGAEKVKGWAEEVYAQFTSETWSFHMKKALARLISNKDAVIQEFLDVETDVAEQVADYEEEEMQAYTLIRAIEAAAENAIRDCRQGPARNGKTERNRGKQSKRRERQLARAAECRARSGKGGSQGGGKKKKGR